MRRKIGRGLETVVIMGALALAFCIAAPRAAHAGKQLTRLSAEITAVDGNAIKLPKGTSPSSPGVIQIYSNSGKIPASDTVVYVTISGEGLGTCDGIALLCQVDGANCVPGNATPGTGLVSAIPSGWVIPLGNEFDGDNSFGLTGVNFQWCKQIKKTEKNIHTVKIFGSTAFGDCNTFLEGVHVYVDTNQISTKDSNPNACGTFATPNPSLSPD